MEKVRRSLVASLGFFVLIAFGLVSTVPQTASADSVSSGGYFVPVGPTRLMDTTNGVDTTSGTGCCATAFGSGTARPLKVTGVAGVPSSGVAAVVLDIDVTSATADSNIEAYSSDQSASSGFLHFGPASVPVSNTTMVAPGPDGKIYLRNNAGAADLNVDITGYFTSTASSTSGGFHTVTPVRIATSSGNGTAPVNVATGQASSGQLTGSVTYSVDAGGVGDIPANATAVFANVRVLNATSPGGIRVAATNASVPSNSEVNFDSSDDNDAGVAIKLGPDGGFKFQSTQSTASQYDIWIDVEGYFVAGDNEAAFHPLNAPLIYDGRTTALALGAGKTVDVTATGSASGIPADGSAGAVAVTLIAEHWSDSSGGTLAAYDPDTGQTGTSDIAYAGSSAYSAAGETTTAIVELSDDGQIELKNTSATSSVQVAVAAQGWFEDPRAMPHPDLADDTTSPTSPAPPDTTAPDTGPPTVAGQFANGAGVGQAGLKVDLTETPLTGDEAIGDEVNAVDLGAATTDSNGNWSITLPDPLPPSVQAAADANGGVLNLQAQAFGASSDGTPFTGTQALSTSVLTGSSTTVESDATRSAGADASANRGVMLPTTITTNGSPTPAAATETTDADYARSAATAEYNSDSAADDNDPVAPHYWQTDDGSSLAGFNAQVVNGVDHSTATILSPQAENAASATDPTNHKKVPWYGCTRLSTTLKDSKYGYTTMGEAHAYWDAKATFTFTATSSSTLGVYDSFNGGTDFSLEGHATITKTAAVGLFITGSAGKDGFARQARVSVKYDKSKVLWSCNGLNGLPEGWYSGYEVTAVKIANAPGAEPVKMGKSVPVGDGYPSYENARAARKYRGSLEAGTGITASGGRMTEYSTGVAIFGVGVTETTASGTSTDETLEALKHNSRPHYYWCALNGEYNCGVLHSY